MRQRRGGSLVVLVLLALAPLAPGGTASAARPLPAAGCEPIAVTGAPGIARLGVRHAVQCAPPTQLGGLLVAAPEGVWANTRDGNLIRLDPQTFAVTATVDVRYVQGIVVRDDGLWALAQNIELVDRRDLDVLDLVHVDRATGQILSTTRLPVAASHSSDDQAYLATTGDTLWVAQANVRLVAAVNPADSSVIATIPLPGRAEAMAGNATTLWIESWTDDRTGTSNLVAVDAATNTIAQVRSCGCGGIGRASKLIATESDVWFSGSAMTHVDLATSTLTTRPSVLTGGLATNGADLWALGPVTITFPVANDGPHGLISRIEPGTSEPVAGAIVPMRARYDSLGPISTSDGRNLYALRNRYSPAGDNATTQSIVRLTLAR